MEDLLDEEISRPKPERRGGAAQVRICGQGKGSEAGWAITHTRAVCLGRILRTSRGPAGA